MTEREQFINKKVYLWGKTVAKKSLLNEYDKGDQHPSRRKTRTVKEAIVREFNIGEEYYTEDLPFLNDEYDRLTNILEKKYDEDIEDKQEKLYDYIEGLEAVNNMRLKQGSGLKTKDVPLSHKKAEPVVKTGVKVVENQAKKARLVKGSEEAKEFGKRMAEARKLKAVKVTEKEIIEVKKLSKKPYYYIGDIPKGYREATMEEAITNNKVSEIGKYQVNLEILGYYKDYGILLNPLADEAEIRIKLSILNKKTLRAIEDIEIFENKIRNDKYKDRLNEFKNKLTTAKDQKKTYNAMYNFYWKLWSKLKGVEYKKVKILKPVAKEVTPSIKKVIDMTPHVFKRIDERTGKQVEPQIIKNKSLKADEYYFERLDGVEISLKKDYFDSYKRLKPKYAKKLFKKNIYLEEKYYKPSDIKKYFYYEQIIGHGVFSCK